MKLVFLLTLITIHFINPCSLDNGWPAYHLESRDNRENIAHYFVLNQDGTLHSTHRFENTVPIEDDYYNPSALGNEWVTYRIQSSSECVVVFQNIITDEQQVFERNEDGCSLPAMIIWNSNYSYAYLSGESLWLWSENGLQPLDVETTI